MALDLATLPSPYTADFKRWSALVVEQLAEYNVPTPVGDGESGWNSWAAQLGADPNVLATGVPSPYGFSEWRSWAARWLQSS